MTTPKLLSELSDETLGEMRVFALQQVGNDWLRLLDEHARYKAMRKRVIAIMGGRMVHTHDLYHALKEPALSPDASTTETKR